MPELPEDDIRHMPDADRIRNRIRERREAEQTEQSEDGTGFEAPGASVTHSIEFEQIVDAPVTSQSKLDGAEFLTSNDPESWKLDELKSGDLIDPLDSNWKVEEGESLLDKASTHLDTPQPHGVVDHKANDVAGPVDTAWKVEEGESLHDTAASGHVKTGEFIDTDTDSVVDHKADDVAMKLDRPDANFEEIKVTLTDPLPDGVVDHKADDVVDHKADDVDGPITNDPFNYEEIKVTFDDPITDTRLDKASPKGLPVDESAEPSGDSGYEGTVATGGVTAGDTDGSVLDGTLKFAVPTDAPGEGDSLKSVSGMDEAIVPTGETAMQQQAADPVGDALAPLDGGDQLVDPAPDSADLIAQIDGVHDDDVLDDSFGA